MSNFLNLLNSKNRKEVIPNNKRPKNKTQTHFTCPLSKVLLNTPYGLAEIRIKVALKTFSELSIFFISPFEAEDYFLQVFGRAISVGHCSLPIFFFKQQHWKPSADRMKTSPIP